MPNVPLFSYPAMQVRTYYYEIKLVESPGEEESVGLQIEDFCRPQTGKLQTYKVFLIQVRACLQRLTLHERNEDA